MQHGNWTVIEEAPRRGKYRYMLCRCACGRQKEVYLGNLHSGKSTQCKHCGNTKHGLTKHPLSSTWDTMIQRCTNPNRNRYKDYGGRGITVCEQWRNNFKAFYDFCMKNGWKQGLEIDRINNDGNYSPENCRFVTPRQNSINRRKRKTNTSGYTGVYKHGNNWRAQITINGKKHYLGTHPCRFQACLARDRYIREHHLPHKLQLLR